MVVSCWLYINIASSPLLPMLTCIDSGKEYGEQTRERQKNLEEKDKPIKKEMQWFCKEADLTQSLVGHTEYNRKMYCYEHEDNFNRRREHDEVVGLIKNSRQGLLC